MIVTGAALIAAIARSNDLIGVRDEGGLEIERVHPIEALSMVTRGKYSGRVRDGKLRYIRFKGILPQPVVIDSGFGIGRYPLPSQSGCGPKFPALARLRAGLGVLA